MSTLKIIAVVLVTAIAAGATGTAWAAPQQSHKTYLPGEGGCKDDSGQGWVTYGCD